MPVNYLFNEDIFLLTDHPVAAASLDHQNNAGSGSINDFTDGTEFAADLLRYFPERRTLIDLGTATGTAPLTMRRAGMLAVGLEGSDAPRKKGLGCWVEMPDIVETCDIGKPFKLIDAHGTPITFDFVTTWDVIEHIPEIDIRQAFANIDALMHRESILILEFSLAYNPLDGYHQLWERWEDGSRKDGSWEARDVWLRELVGERFTIDDGLKNLCDWRYCRPSAGERQCSRDDGLDEFPLSRPVWWLRKKNV